jgi:hypothetical protein
LEMIYIKAEERLLTYEVKHEPDNKEILKINIRYPFFGETSDIIKKINGFYADINNNLTEYLHKDYAKESIERYEKNEDPRKKARYKIETVTSNYKIGLSTDEILSLYIEYVFSMEGHPVRRKRFAQTWDLATGDIMKLFLFRDKNKKHPRVPTGFSRHNFYISPKGIHFFKITKPPGGGFEVIPEEKIVLLDI